MNILCKIALTACCLAPALPMWADAIPYPNKGTVASSVATYAASSNGVGIDLYYYGSSAGYTDSVQVYDITTGFKSTPILTNHTTTPGTEVIVGKGSINTGDQIVFLLDTPSGAVYASDAAYSADKANHVYITSYSGGTINGVSVPAGLFLGFEDQPITKSDLDYNDLELVTTGVTTSITPEPTSLALFGTGIFGLAGAWKRRLA